MADVGDRAHVFGAVAAQYADHRPGYPAAALDWVLAPLGPGPAHVVDLAAGTGKLAEALLARPGVAVTAVEPDRAMLRELVARVPGARAVAGTAEEVPLRAGCADAVLVGTAWHWFDGPRATAEIARVLRPGGVLGVLWTGDDPAVGWVRGFHEAAEDGRPVPSALPAGSPVPPHLAFPAPAERVDVRHGVPTTVDGLIATLGTHSWALVSEPADREAAFVRVRDYLAGRPETAGGSFTLPLVTAAVRALRSHVSRSPTSVRSGT